jgi:hypothetical protein
MLNRIFFTLLFSDTMPSLRAYIEISPTRIDPAAAKGHADTPEFNEPIGSSAIRAAQE